MTLPQLRIFNADDHANVRAGRTGRAIDVVQLIALGHCNKEIAARLEISVKVAETHEARAPERLGLHSRADLVQCALQEGCLQGGRA